MYIKIRDINAKPGENELLITVTKMMLIKHIKQRIEEKWNYVSKCQRLYYKGKQLHDDNSIIDYNVQLNDVIQLLLKPEDEKTADSALENTNTETECCFYQRDDLVDVRNNYYGSWCEAVITNIEKKDRTSPDLIYYVELQGVSPPMETSVKFDDIRPRSKHTYSFQELSVGQKVMVNYNIENPNEMGYWYDLHIEELNEESELLLGRLYVADQLLDQCKVTQVNRIMRIEKSVLYSTPSVKNADILLEKVIYSCDKCNSTDALCTNCGCCECGEKNRPEHIVICDECDYGYHISCLDPPLLKVPEETEWFCPICKTDNDIVKAGDKVKISDKKSRMPSASSKGKDWGRGMACVGRTTECTIVPKNHYGPIPGIDVGMCWKFRFQVSEAGVHRPHVAGIHGRETDGAYSLVLSGGYEDDVDNGKEFIYTGSGGRDLSGNKRVSNQSCDQTLTRMNKALAMNCNENDWKAGKPVRVVRNYKLSKHSKYAPKSGNRYDGLYKVVKYYCEKGKSGFQVWKYLLRRDDPSPPPWTKNGNEFDVIFPPGYLEAQGNTSATSSKGKSKRNTIVKTSSKKRTHSDESLKTNKKSRLEKFTPPKNVCDLIAKDTANKKLWDECGLQETKQAYISKVQELFMCICCQEVVFKPVTTICSHNICLTCMKRSFAAEIYTCPHCRADWDHNCMEPNEILAKILMVILPGYESGR